MLLLFMFLVIAGVWVYFFTSHEKVVMEKGSRMIGVRGGENPKGNFIRFDFWKVGFRFKLKY